MPGARAATPVVIAHRGASGYLPEHTLPAKALAVGQGADFVEQDVVASRDGVPVVLHDIHLDGVSDVAERFPGRARADGRYYCADFTLAELKSLAIVERFDHRDGAQIYPGRFPKDDGRLTLATLEEELRFLAGLSKSLGRPVGIYPEIKQPAFHRQEGHDLSRLVLDVLARAGYATRSDRCYVQCFDPAEVRRIRTELGWQGNLVQLVGGDATELVAGDGLARIAAVADGLGPALELVIGKDGRATDLVERAHAAGLVVHPWTARRDALPRWVGSFDELMERLGGAGVDGVFTDFPDLAVAWRARHGERGGKP
ncbi:MAG: glycerophosphodiester phosphodiesterase [Planctomycetes bacterium]|nr:glycerophosphodiester phosphodiesterase [Planctomycetota bacterium]